MWDSIGHGWGNMGFGMLLWMLIGIAILVLAVYSITRGSTSASEPIDHALEILRERYARGQIDQQEFDERKRELEK
jgi:putative membrane protein